MAGAADEKSATKPWRAGPALSLDFVSQAASSSSKPGSPPFVFDSVSSFKPAAPLPNEPTPAFASSPKLESTTLPPGKPRHPGFSYGFVSALPHASNPFSSLLSPGSGSNVAPAGPLPKPTSDLVPDAQASLSSRPIRDSVLNTNPSLSPKADGDSTSSIQLSPFSLPTSQSVSNTKPSLFSKSSSDSVFNINPSPPSRSTGDSVSNTQPSIFQLTSGPVSDTKPSLFSKPTNDLVSNTKPSILSGLASAPAADTWSSLFSRPVSEPVSDPRFATSLPLRPTEALASPARTSPATSRFDKTSSYLSPASEAASAPSPHFRRTHVFGSSAGDTPAASPSLPAIRFHSRYHGRIIVRLPKTTPLALESSPLSRWNLYTVLGLVNAESTWQTCTAVPSGSSQRCSKHLPDSKRLSGLDIAKSLQRRLPVAAARQYWQLLELAASTLCSAHLSQAGAVAQGWKLLLLMETLRLETAQVHDPDVGEDEKDQKRARLDDIQRHHVEISKDVSPQPSVSPRPSISPQPSASLQPSASPQPSASRFTLAASISSVTADALRDTKAQVTRLREEVKQLKARNEEQVETISELEEKAERATERAMDEHQKAEDCFEQANKRATEAREVAKAVRECLSKSREHILQEGKELRAMRQGLSQGQEELERERKSFALDRAELDRERNEIKEERAKLDRERNEIKEERAKLDRERNEIKEERAKLDRERNGIKEERSKINHEREELNRDRNVLDRQRNDVDRESIKLERDRLQLEKETSARVSERSTMDEEQTRSWWKKKAK